MSCGASGRGGLLGIELITTTYGKVYNGITDDESHVDNLNPLVVLTHVNTPELTVDCWWEVVVSPHASCLFGWSRDQHGSSGFQSPLLELIDQHGCHFRFDGS